MTPFVLDLGLSTSDAFGLDIQNGAPVLFGGFNVGGGNAGGSTNTTSKTGQTNTPISTNAKVASPNSIAASDPGFTGASDGFGGFEGLPLGGNVLETMFGLNGAQVQTQQQLLLKQAGLGGVGTLSEAAAKAKSAGAANGATAGEGLPIIGIAAAGLAALLIGWKLLS